MDGTESPRRDPDTGTAEKRSRPSGEMARHREVMAGLERLHQAILSQQTHVQIPAGSLNRNPDFGRLWDSFKSTDRDDAEPYLTAQSVTGRTIEGRFGASGELDARIQALDETRMRVEMVNKRIEGVLNRIRPRPPVDGEGTPEPAWEEGPALERLRNVQTAVFNRLDDLDRLVNELEEL